ncbi:MAG: hypothetical protein H6510_11260 [Acidobacteria bacterium]|nr:hypothetical protein [Acidobacteriota bacterium]
MTLRLLDEQRHALVGISVRVESPIGVQTTQTDENGEIKIPLRYPRVSLALGHFPDLVYLPNEIDLQAETASIEVVVDAALLARLKGGH